MRGFEQWQTALIDNQWATEIFTDPLLIRWQRVALAEVQRPKSAQRRDLASLTRQILRRETLSRDRSQSNHFGDPQATKLTIPKPTSGQPWPTEAEWAACGVRILEHLPEHLRVEALPWQPAFAKGGDPAADATAELQRRRDTRVAADPLFRYWTGHPTYSSFGQRQAMRALWYAKPGSTLLSVLPTGTGKSALLQVSGLEATTNGALCVVVVPTVALALDQARAMQSHLSRHGLPVPEHLAYHGGLSRQQKWRLRERISLDQQGILFTSPEGLLGSLAASLFPVAERGKLALFAVDEVHLASQWGNDFRPEFQLLSGLRQALLDACPRNAEFCTLLLTATLTTADFQALAELFGRPGPLQVIGAVHLRPEPAYWSAQFQTEEERQAAVIDAVRHAPKPLIVYTSRVSDARKLHHLLLEDGFQRVGLLTGESTPQERQWVIDAWNASELDIVVGTSAFGVGIDQKHVRTVLHACVPEGIDRYYQEVGRGGRDGRAMLALALITPTDWIVAEKLADQRLISVGRGLERWKRMFMMARRLDDFQYQLDGNLQPADLIRENERSRNWNMNVLNLMARAGLIRLNYRPPPSFPAELRDLKPQEFNFQQRERYADYERRLEQHQRAQWIEILDGSHKSPATWQQKVEPLRQRTRASTQNQLSKMRQLLLGNGNAAEILQAFYTTILGTDQQEHVLRPLAACGGCPACRQSQRPPYTAIDPRPAISHWYARLHQLPLLKAGRPAVLVCNDPTELFPSLKFLVEHGIQVIRDERRTLSPENWDILQQFSTTPLLVGSTSYLLEPPLPTVTILPPEQAGLSEAMLVCTPQAPWQVILLQAEQANVNGEPLDLHSVDILRLPIATTLN